MNAERLLKSLLAKSAADGKGLDSQGSDSSGNDLAAVLAAVSQLRAAAQQHDSLQTFQVPLMNPPSILDLMASIREVASEVFDIPETSVVTLLVSLHDDSLCSIIVYNTRALLLQEDPVSRVALFNTSMDAELTEYCNALEQLLLDEVEENAGAAKPQDDDAEDEDVVPVDESRDVMGQGPAVSSSQQRAQKASQLRVSLGLQDPSRTPDPSLSSKKSFSRSRSNVKVSPGLAASTPAGRGSGARGGAASFTSPAGSGGLGGTAGGGPSSAPRSSGRRIASSGTAGLMGLTFSPATPAPSVTPAGGSSSVTASGAGGGGGTAGGPAPTERGNSLFNLFSPGQASTGAASSGGQRLASAGYSGEDRGGGGRPRGSSMEDARIASLMASHGVGMQVLARQAMSKGACKVITHKGAKVTPWIPDMSPASSMSGAGDMGGVAAGPDTAGAGAEGAGGEGTQRTDLLQRGSMASMLSAVTEEGLLPDGAASVVDDSKSGEAGRRNGRASAAPLGAAGRFGNQGSSYSLGTPGGAAEGGEVPPRNIMVVGLPVGPDPEVDVCAGSILLALPADRVPTASETGFLAEIARMAGAGRAHVEEQQRAEQARLRSVALVQMIQAVSHEVTVPDIIKRIVGVAYELLQADRVSVFLVDKERQEIVLAISEDAAGLRLPMGKGIVGHCARTGEVINIRDVYESDMFDRSFDIRTGYRTRSLLAFPVRDMEGGVTAVIQAINKQGAGPGGVGQASFTPGDIRMLGLVADTAGVTLHKAKLLQDALLARMANEALMDVVKLSNELDSYTDLDALVNALTEIASRLVDAERVQLFLLDEVKKELFAPAWSGAGGGLTGGADTYRGGAAESEASGTLPTTVGERTGGLVRVPLGQGLVGHCATSGQTLVIANAYSNPLFNKDQDEKEGFKTRNLLCMPVRVRVAGAGGKGHAGRVVAVIYAANKRGAVTFSASDEELLDTFGTEVATTIDKRSVQLSMSKALADEAEQEAGSDGAAGGGAGAGKMSSLLGQYLRHPTMQPGGTLRAAPSQRRMSNASSLSSRAGTPTGMRSRRGSSTGATLGGVVPLVGAQPAGGTAGTSGASLGSGRSGSPVPLTGPPGGPTGVAGASTGRGGLGGGPSLNTKASAGGNRMDEVTGVMASPKGLAAGAAGLGATSGAGASAQGAGSSNPGLLTVPSAPVLHATPGQGGGSLGSAQAAHKPNLERQASSAVVASAKGGADTPREASTATGGSGAGGAGAGGGAAGGAPGSNADKDHGFQLDLDQAPWRKCQARSGRSEIAHRGPQSWEWDILGRDDLELCAFLLDMMHTFDLFKALRIDLGTMASFVDSVRVAYRPNPYHNFKHGVSVVHVCFLALYHAPVATLSLTHSIDRLALLLAGLCHDVDHPGVNNAYESNALTPLAIQYNDASVLEHHHAAVMFELLRAGERSHRPVHATTSSNNPLVTAKAGSKADPWATPGTGSAAVPTEEVVSVLALPRPLFTQFRRLAINAILATDMSHHSDLTEQARKVALPASAEGVTVTAEALPSKFVAEMLVHSADLSNPVLPHFAVVDKWADLVCAEFSAQVAAEKAQGLPFAPHMDGLTSRLAVAKLQIGFIDYVVSPLWNAVGTILPEFKVAVSNMATNRGKWKAIVDEETAKQQAAAAAAAAAAATPVPGA